MLRLIRLRTLSAKLRGLEPGPEASVRKAMSDEHGQHVMAMAKTLAGAHGMLADHGPYAESRRRHVELRLPLLARAHDRRRHERGAAQHPRRESARPGAEPGGRTARASHVPLQNPTASALTVPSAHRRSGSSWEKTPFGLSQPGTTHACTIHTVFFMKVPRTPSHCAWVMSRSGANGTAIPGPRPYWMQRLECRCQWSFGPGNPDGSAVAERDVHQADDARRRAVAVVDEAARVARVDTAVGPDLAVRRSRRRCSARRARGANSAGLEQCGGRADATVGYCSAAVRATTRSAASASRVAGSSGWSGRFSAISSTLSGGSVVVVRARPTAARGGAGAASSAPASRADRRRGPTTDGHEADGDRASTHLARP